MPRIIVVTPNGKTSMSSVATASAGPDFTNSAHWASASEIAFVYGSIFGVHHFEFHLVWPANDEVSWFLARRRYSLMRVLAIFLFFISFFSFFQRIFFLSCWRGSFKYKSNKKYSQIKSNEITIKISKVVQHGYSLWNKVSYGHKLVDKLISANKLAIQINMELNV